VAKDARDAIAQWLNAGGAVQGFDFGHEEWLEGVTHGVESGAVPIAVLNAAVARVLRVKAWRGATAGCSDGGNASRLLARIASLAFAHLE
jgi:hypothetical protein